MAYKPSATVLRVKYYVLSPITRSMISKTIILKHSKLINNDSLSAIIIRLMMACNDISLANAYQARCQDDDNPKNKDIDMAASMYFVRLQIGHIEEGLGIIREIKDNQAYSYMIRGLSKAGKHCFDKLCACMDGRSKEWNKYFTPIRNNLSFHYNHKN